MAKKEFTAQENSVLKQMWLRSHMTFINFSMTKMEANCFTMTLMPALKTIYEADSPEMKDALQRSQSFFNTHAVPLAFIAGLTYAMEKDHAEGKVDTTTIENIKAALMGPTAGMFDSLFFNCLRVIAAGIAIGLNRQGNFLGSVIFILLYGVTQSIAKYLLLTAGYSLGTTFIDQVFNSGLIQVLTKCAGVLGLMMVGAMTAQMVGVPIALTINTGAGEVVIADVINSIFQGLLGVILLFVMVNLIKKGWRPTQLIGMIFIFALVGALIGLF